MSPRWLAALGLGALSLGIACGDDDRRPDGGAGDSGADAAAPLDAGGCVAESGECAGGGCCDELVCRSASSGRAFCVQPDDTCFVAPDPGCCLDDADCDDGSSCQGAECRVDGEGRCMSPAPEGECWTERDCPAGSACLGATLCPCGATDCPPLATGTCG